MRFYIVEYFMFVRSKNKKKMDCKLYQVKCESDGITTYDEEKMKTNFSKHDFT